MLSLMKIPRRYLLLATLACLLLVSVISLAATRHASAITPLDCKEDCTGSYNKSVEKCNELPEHVREKCKERAQKHYDKCIERCNNGQSGDAGPGSF